MPGRCRKVAGSHQSGGRRTIRPTACVVAERGVGRATTSKWVKCDRQHGEAALGDLTSLPIVCSSQVLDEVEALIERLRRERKWSARLIGRVGHQRGTVSVRPES